MNRFNLFLARLLVLLFLAVGVGTVLAPDARAVDSCKDQDARWEIIGGDISDGSEITSGLDSISFQVKIGSEYAGKRVELRWNKNGQFGGPTLTSGTVNTQGNVSFTVSDQDFLARGSGIGGGRKIDIRVAGKWWCHLAEIFVVRDVRCTSAQVIQGGNIDPYCIDAQSPVTLRWTAETTDGPYEGVLRVQSKIYPSSHPTFVDGVGSAEIPVNQLRTAAGSSVDVELQSTIVSIGKVPGCKLTVSNIQINECSEEALEPPPGSLSSETFKLCNQIPASSPARAQCIACTGEEGKEKVWTAVGCISKNPEDIIGTIVEIGIGLAGGIALLMIIAGGFMLTISQGDPQRTNQAKEMITSAIIGLLFVLFSVVILQFIGVTVFQIPGFGTEATVQ